MYDIVFVGAGPCNLSSCNYLKNHSNLNFLMIDMGRPISERDHKSPKDSVIGEGGAGFYSDGKYSFFPAGTTIWDLPNKIFLRRAYDYLETILKNFCDIPPFPTNNGDSNLSNEWNLKEYQSIYLSLDDRKSLINDLTKMYRESIMANTEVVDIIDEKSKYVIICKNILSGQTYEIFTKKIVLGGGRFMPLFLKQIKIIPMKFKRLEFGVRIEGPAQSELYNCSFRTDPKFIKYDSIDNVEYRTFCWCRNGEAVCTNSNGILTYSGRSDCEPTIKSNFGMNVRFKNDVKIDLMNKALNTDPFQVSLNNHQQIPKNYQNIYQYLHPQIISFLDFIGIRKAEYHNYTLLGPTIEGVGEYPVTDENLKISNSNIWIGGDACGKFRGIVAAMISGIYIAMQLVDLVNNKKKPIVILLSGKRFNGKGEASKILKKHYEEMGKSVLITSFSYHLKKIFCDKNDLNFDKFMNDHEYKDSHRNALTAFLDISDPVSFTKLSEELIDKNEYDVYIFDDLRSLRFQLEYINKNCRDKWTIHCLRINSTEKSRESRGWTRTPYDDHYCENELDDYNNFDGVINNDSTIDDLEKNIRLLNFI